MIFELQSSSLNVKSGDYYLDDVNINNTEGYGVHYSSDAVEEGEYYFGMPKEYRGYVLHVQDTSDLVAPVSLTFDKATLTAPEKKDQYPLDEIKATLKLNEAIDSSYVNVEMYNKDGDKTIWLSLSSNGEGSTDTFTGEYTVNTYQYPGDYYLDNISFYLYNIEYSFGNDNDRAHSSDRYYKLPASLENVHFTVVNKGYTAGWKQDAKGYWYLNTDGSYPAGKFQEIDGKWYYFKTDGYMQTGWLQLNGKWYYFDPANGDMYINCWGGDGNNYWFKNDGTMAVNETVDGGRYTVGADGKYTTANTSDANGWKYDETGNWKYYENYIPVKSAWRKINNSWYYFDKNYHMVTGTININGTEYYFEQNGELYVGPDYIDDRVDTIWTENGKFMNGWYHLNQTYEGDSGWCYVVNGSPVYDQWVGDYYFNSKGFMATNAWIGDAYVGADGKKISQKMHGDGWVSTPDGWQFYQSGEPAKNQWIGDNGKWYYVDKNGYVTTDVFKNIKDQRYYFNSDGVMQTGWFNLDDTDWYYFDNNGYEEFNWQYINGSWYYFNNAGQMCTGWKKINGSWYYFESSGAMAANKWVGNYYVDGNGVMATNQWIGNYHVNASGVWDQTK